jgi:hypothetical protein
MLTTPEQREAAHKIGWNHVDQSKGPERLWESWRLEDAFDEIEVGLYKEEGRLDLELVHYHGRRFSLSPIFDLAAIFGIAPFGHVLVPDKVAKRALLFVETCAKRAEEEAPRFTDELTVKTKLMGAEALRDLAVSLKGSPLEEEKRTDG